MIGYRFTLTTTYLNGNVETDRCDYVYEAYDKLALIERQNDYYHDVASVTLYDGKYGDTSVYRMEEEE